MNPPPAGCHTTLRRSTAGLKCCSTTCGKVQRRASQFSISCILQPFMTHSTGLRTPSAPTTPKVSSAVRGCMQRGSERGFTGIAPHVAWPGTKRRSRRCTTRPSERGCRPTSAAASAAACASPWRGYCCGRASACGTRPHAAHALGGEAGLTHALRHTRALQLGRVPLAEDLVCLVEVEPLSRRQQLLSAAQLTSRICDAPTKITPANVSRTSP